MEDEAVIKKPQGAESLPQFKTRNGWALLEIPPGMSPLTNETLADLENADYDEEYRRAFSPQR